MISSLSVKLWRDTLGCREEQVVTKNGGLQWALLQRARAVAPDVAAKLNGSQPVMQSPFLPAPEQLSLQLAWAARHDYARARVHFTPAVTVPFAWFVREGALQIDVDGEAFRVAAGDWVWHPPCAARRMEATSGGASWLSVGLSARCGASDWFAPLGRHQFALPPEQSERGQTLLGWLCDAHADQSSLERDGLARAFVGWLWRASGARGRPHFPAWLEQSLARIEAQPDVTIAQLAHEAHYSAAQFRRAWQHWMGASPRETLLQRRLERAQHVLQNEDVGLEIIAQRCGFGSATALRRAFAARVGVSPLQWRDASRERV